MAKLSDHDLILESILGLMIIDEKGMLVYINQQCADYIKVNKDKVLGQHINKVFPPSWMPKLLKGEKRFNTDFYFYKGRMSVSTQVQLRESGRIIGVLEYDTIQELQTLEDFFSKYSSLLSDESSFYREQLRSIRRTKYSIDNLAGSSGKMKSLKSQIRLAAMSNSTVLIIGETGTGKELVAHAIHNLSRRSLGNFVKINSSSVPETLAESEFFGYEEGAFTGAKKQGRKGKFELADKGTLFIDEINQMPLFIQPKILRVLQEHEIERIGGEESINVDIRIIAATNEKLDHLVKQKQFRQDLFYRLNVFSIEIPPLRERLEDLPELVMSKINQMNLETGKSIIAVEPEVYQRFEQQSWPGNVRELFNVIEHAMIYADGDTLTLTSLNAGGMDPLARREDMNLGELAQTGNPIQAAREMAEREIISKTLQLFGGNKTKAARFLKIQRPLLYQKMKRLGI